MNKLLFVLLLLPGVVWAQGGIDTLRPNANGDYLNWDDDNTAGCAATASNWDRVDDHSDTDTISVDAIVGVCNTGDQFTSHHLADFTVAHDAIDSVRIRVRLRGTIATDSARIGIKVGVDTIWSTRFAVTTSFVFYEFASATTPLGVPWDNGTVNAVEIAVHSKLAAVGRIWDTQEHAVIRSTIPLCCAPPPGAPSQPGAVRFYFPSTGLPPDTIRFGLGLTTNWQDTSVAGTNNWRHKLVIHTASNTAIATRTETSTATTPETHCLGQWVSDLMSRQTFLGTIKGQVKAIESATGLNGNLAIAMYVINKDGTSLGQLMPITRGDATTTPPEFATSFTNRQFLNSAEVTPVPMTAAVTAQAESCRLVVELGFGDASTSTTQTGSLRIGDPTDSTDLGENATQTAAGRPWVEVLEGPALWQAGLKQDTLTPAANGTYLVWTNPACSADPTQIDEGEANDGDATYILSDELTGSCGTGPGKGSYTLSDFNGTPVDSIIKVEFVGYARSFIGNALEAPDSFRVFTRTTTDKFNEALDGNLIGTSYAKRNVIFTCRPNTGNWTDAQTDSAQLGFESFLLATAGEEQRVTLGYAVVYWKEAAAGAPDDRRRRILLMGKTEDESEEAPVVNGLFDRTVR